MGDYSRFLVEFVTKKRVIGAVAPSSTGLAKQMVEWVDWPNVRTAMEYGPGTGVFTKELLASLRPEARLVAVEIDPHFAQMISARFPSVSVHQASVEGVELICRREGMDRVDAIICGLP